MPFPLAPNSWAALTGRRRRTLAARERGHGDGMTHDLDTPEAIRRMDLLHQNRRTRARQPGYKHGRPQNERSRRAPEPPFFQVETHVRDRRYPQRDAVEQPVEAAIVRSGGEIGRWAAQPDRAGRQCCE